MGHACFNRAHAVPTSQGNPNRSRTMGRISIFNPKRRASGSAVCNARVYGEATIRVIRSPARRRTASSA